MNPYILKIQGFLKHYKIPAEEYSFSGKTGKKPDLCGEKRKQLGSP